MGIHDRDYYRKSPSTARQLFTWTETAVGVLLAINVICYVAQLGGGPGVTRFLSARGEDVFNGQVWKLLTANFAHSDRSIMHILGNMFFLYFLGKELEQIYGRRDFYILYLSAGVLAVLAEVTSLQLAGHGHTMVLGASGAVMAVVVLCALFYPHKIVSFLFFLPAPLWLLCVMYVAMDLLGVFRGSRDGAGVANLAHLTGALVGFLYRLFDLRWSHLRSLLRLPLRARGARARPRGRIVAMPRPVRPAAPAQETPPPDPVYQRVDELLAKISHSGMDSLTGEEIEFLRENSTRFRRSD